MQAVAACAGVSLSTVSRYLTKSSQVSDDLRTKIEAAVARTGYKYERSINPIVHGIIAMFVPDILNPVYMEITKGAQDEADNFDDSLFVINASENPKQQQNVLRCLNKKEIVGIIVCGWRLPLSSIISDFKERNNIPLVLIGRRVEQGRIPCILVDHEKAMYQAARYLLELNHRKIAYLSAPTSWDTSRAKVSGLKNAMNQYGFEPRPEFLAEGLPTIESGFQLANQLLQLPPKDLPTAIIAHNDLMALGAIHSIRGRGLSIPKDISVMGYDDIAMATHSNPSLSTIAIPKYRMGQIAVDMVRKARVADEVSSFTFLECPLVIRESTAPVSLGIVSMNNTRPHTGGA